MEIPKPTILCDKCNHTFSPSDLNESFRETVSHEALHSSYIPTETERSQTLHYLRNEEPLLQQYDQEVHRLCAIVAKLKAERNLLRQRIEDRRYSISVMRRMPVELWHKVFSYVCAAHDYTLAVRTDKIMAVTRDLSHVCHRWREIVTGLPHVWSSVFVEFPGYIRDYRPLLDTYLQNAKDAPLTLCIEGPLDTASISDSGSEGESYMGEVATSALRMLMQHLPHCESLELDLSPHLLSIAPAPTGPSPSLSLPQLHTFYNIVDMSDEETLTENNRWFWDAIRFNAPNLSIVETDDLRELRLFPCAQLTTLHLRHVGNVNGLLHMIDGAPKLRTLTIDDMDDFDGTDLTAAPVVSSLRDLTVLSNSTPTTVIADLLSFLTLPCLKVITLKGEYRQGAGIAEGDWAASLVGMLRRYSDESPCCVKRISLDLGMEDDFSDDFLNDILQCCPKLTNLELKLLPNGKAPASLHAAKLLSDLTILVTEADATTSTDHPRPILAPKLKKLKIWESVQTLGLDGAEAIVRMAESRASNRVQTKGSGATALSRVSVVIEEVNGVEGVNHCNMVFGSRLRALEEGGTKCQIRCT
ncbi:hypothetical protein AAF712_001157 [Marasmius tenuissimus]|uniref:F-box domain-containing protein n=1 Tax=Marasmius tenuissimus TaxID=585030 RepID=A0ABR3AFU4_9AGAR